MQKFNLDYLNELKRKVESEKERHEIIGLAVCLGSYNVREALAPKGYFSRSRDITSKIQEAIHIAKEQESVLRLLEKHSPIKVIGSLERAISTVSQRNSIPESELSKCIRHSQAKRDQYATIGRRIETKLSR